MALGILSYPNIESADYQIIQEFRSQFDVLYYNMVAPHFSFVFPTVKFNQTQFIAEAQEKAKDTKFISFKIRCANINKDAFLDYYHCVLVPDQGYSNIVKLHDLLYSGLFFEELRLDIDFIPHLGIANAKDPYLVKKWVDGWNAKDFIIEGRINKLMVIDYTDDELCDLAEIPLKM